MEEQTATSTSRVDARIIQTEYGFEVHPSTVSKHRGGTFTIRNITGSRAHVCFPDRVTRPRDHDIDPGTNEEFRILEPDPGVYDYQVEVLVSDDRNRQIRLRASGGSDPRIIIDF